MTVEEKAKSLAELVGGKVSKKKLIDALIEMAAWQRLMDCEDGMSLPFREYDNLMDSINEKKKEGYMAGLRQGYKDSLEDDIVKDIEKEFDIVWSKELSGKIDTEAALRVARHFAAWQKRQDDDEIKSKAMHHCEEGWEIGKLELKEQLVRWLTKESHLMHEPTGRSFSKQYRQQLCKEIIDKIEELVK